MSRESQLLIAALLTPDVQAQFAELGRDLEQRPEQLRAWVARLAATGQDDHIGAKLGLPEHCEQ